MDSLNFRRATEHDIDQLMNLMYQYIVDFYNKPRPNERDLQDLIMHLLNNPTIGVQFVAEKDGKLIGFSTLYFTFSTTMVKKIAVLNDLFVTSNARGQKIGEALFKKSLEYVKEHHYAAMTWETAHDNKVGQSLYKKMGGKQTNADWLHYEIKTI